MFDEEIKQVATKFVDLPTCNIGTADELFATIAESFEKRRIPWENMVGYGSDNASVMVGNRNSVLVRLREKQPLLIDLGYIYATSPTCAVS